MPAEGVLCHHEHVIDKREHYETLLNRLPPLIVLLSKVPKVVIGHDHTPGLRGKTHNEAIIITDYVLLPDSPRWCEDQRPLHLQLVEDVLIGDGVLCARWFPSPLRDKDSDGLMAALLEPLDRQLNTLAGEHSAISVPEEGEEGREGEERGIKEGREGEQERGERRKEMEVKESAICKLCEQSGIETSNNIVPYLRAKC